MNQLESSHCVQQYKAVVLAALAPQTGTTHTMQTNVTRGNDTKPGSLLPRNFASSYGGKEAEKMENFLKELLSKSVTDTPEVAAQLSIPEKLRSNVLNLTTTPLSMHQLPTLFIGSLSSNFNETVWQDHVKKWCEYFQLAPESIHEIPMLPVPESQMVLNSTDAAQKIHVAIHKINGLPEGAPIRVIVLGVRGAGFFYEAMKYLLLEWKLQDGTPRASKKMQFVTPGDTSGNEFSDFCKWLCLSGICQSIEFFNASYYTPFGYCRAIPYPN